MDANIQSNRQINRFVSLFSDFLGENLSQNYFLNYQTYIFHLHPPFFLKALTWLQDHPSSPATLVTMTAVDNREKTQTFQIHTVLLIPKLQLMVTLVLDLDEEHPSYEAVTPLIPSANWAEREIHDLFGIVPKGISLPPLVLHRDWPSGDHYPFRRDFKMDKQTHFTEGPLQFHQPNGLGMHQVAVGPIHAGIIEPGHLRFTVTGEQIHQFDAQLFYTHKGIEKMAEGKPIEEGLNLAEHVCGMCAFAHSTAYCQALEALGHIVVPERALQIRAICLELERISSHLSDLTAIGSAGGFAVGSQWAAAMREKLMEQNRMLTGHRFLRGLNAVGGLQRDLPAESWKTLLQWLHPFNKEFQEWVTLVLHEESFLDRLETTGQVTLKQAKTLGLVGPAARGSGVDRDVRRDFGTEIYEKYKIQPPVCTEGDALARTKIRIEEIRQSIVLIQEMTEALLKTSTQAPVSRVQSSRVRQKPEKDFYSFLPSTGLVESAKGELAHWIMLAPDNRIFRWHVRSASYLNWPGVVQATMGNNIVPDGPLVNKSFNLCYACTDR